MIYFDFYHPSPGRCPGDLKVRGHLVVIIHVYVSLQDILNSYAKGQFELLSESS